MTAVTERRAGPGERSIIELFGELAKETRTLVQQEVALATAEIAQKGVRVGRKSLLLGAGVAIGHVSLIALAAVFVIVLADAVPLWIAALIVSTAFAVVGYGVVRAGISAIKRADVRLTETIASFEDNKIWFKQQIH